LRRHLQSGNQRRYSDSRGDNEPVARRVSAILLGYGTTEVRAIPKANLAAARQARLNILIGAAENPCGRRRAGTSGETPYKRLCAQRESGDSPLEEIHDRLASLAQEAAR
jgi:hypothetical protein